MDAMEAIFTRRSTRQFTEQPIEEEKLRKILEAAMSGPCCVHARDWSFVVVTDREKLQQMAAANGEPARCLKGAAAAILVCGDLERAFPAAPEYWIIDGAIAAENICLCAQALGVGSVWLGTWPQKDSCPASERAVRTAGHDSTSFYFGAGLSRRGYFQTAGQPLRGQSGSLQQVVRKAAGLAVQPFSVQRQDDNLPRNPFSAVLQSLFGCRLQTAAAGNLHPDHRYALDVVAL